MVHAAFALLLLTAQAGRATDAEIREFVKAFGKRHVDQSEALDPA